jgi:RNA polymerase sigma factor (sigma-70 family)
MMDAVKRMEAVSALAVRAKADTDAIPELWGMVEKLVQVICRRYRRDDQVRFYEVSDLCQDAFFGFLRAVETFDPQRSEFSTWLIYWIRSACHKAVRRYRGVETQSLSEPILGSNDLTLADILPDPDAESHFEAVNTEMIASVILAEADALPDLRQRRIILECTYQGRTLTSFADKEGITKQGAALVEETAIAKLRRRPALRDMYQEYLAEVHAAADDSATSYTREKGMTSFRSDFTSVVEAIILSREERYGRHD